MGQTMFGPHFYYDLIRLARNRRNIYLRSAYLLALLIAWWFVYERSQPFAGTINDYARLATNFSQSLLIFQYVTILVLAPIYLAGTIVEERENRTLELIYQTQLTDREILLGKFAARVVHLTLFLFLSLPMLAIISLWGGVSMELLVLHFGLSFLYVLLLGSLCLWVSVTSSRYTEAMVLSYVLSGAIGYCSLPFLVIIFHERALPFLLSAPWLQALLAIPFLAGTAFFYRIALRRLKQLRDKKSFDVIIPPRPRPKPRLDIERKPAKTRDIPENSLLWKEMTQNKLALDLPEAMFWIVVVGAAFLGFVSWALRAAGLGGEELADGLKPLFFVPFIYLAMPSLALFTFQTTSSVARERERNTLDFLLLLPCERREVLFYKWVAPWLRARVAFCILLAVPIIGMTFGLWSIRLGLVMLLAPWPMVFFANSVGLLLSILCRRVVTANLLLLSVLGMVLIVHLAFWDSFQYLLQCYERILDELNARKGHAPTDNLDVLVPIVIHLGIFLIFGALTLGLAFRIFERRTSEVRTLAG